MVTSTGADIGAAIVAALGALSGPLHGGAPDRALASLDEIGTPDRIEPWVRARVAAVTGSWASGTPCTAPRIRGRCMLREVRASGWAVSWSSSPPRWSARWSRVLAELKPERQLYANVEFYAGVVMELCGLPRSMFTPTFAVSRVVGWSANVLEQAQERRIIRPAARYTGPPAPQPVPPGRS